MIKYKEIANSHLSENRLCVENAIVAHQEIIIKIRISTPSRGRSYKTIIKVAFGG